MTTSVMPLRASAPPARDRLRRPVSVHASTNAPAPRGAAAARRGSWCRARQHALAPARGDGETGSGEGEEVRRWRVAAHDGGTHHVAGGGRSSCTHNVEARQPAPDGRVTARPSARRRARLRAGSPRGARRARPAERLSPRSRPRDSPPLRTRCRSEFGPRGVKSSRPSLKLTRAAFTVTVSPRGAGGSAPRPPGWRRRSARRRSKLRNPLTRGPFPAARGHPRFRREWRSPSR